MEIKAYKNDNDEVELDMDTVFVSMWNAYLEALLKDNKIHFNNKEFFENAFKNAYDAVWAVSLSGRWRHDDEFVSFDEDGYLVSFTHWNDENSPINLNKIDIDIDNFIQSIKKQQKNKKRYDNNNISREISDALKEI